MTELQTLSINDASYSIRGKPLVVNFDLTLSPGEVVALIGPNGAGKSTALKMLSGELTPDQGKVTLAGQDIQSLRPDQLAMQRSVMAQAVHVVFEFTVREIIKMGWVQGRILSQTHFQRAASEVVNLCELEHLLDRAFNTLSGGEQQRVQFARNLLQLWRPPGQIPEARFLLLDEPTASMDLRHELMLLAQLRLAKEQNIGVLIVLHDLNLAARFMDRVVLMRYGQIVKAGSPQQVLDETLLSDVYQTLIRVEHNTQLNRMVVHT